MANFNTLIKRKQYIWLGLILAGGAAAVGGGLYLSDLNMSSDEEAPAQGEPAPDMTGVVNKTFDDKVQQSAVTEFQLVNKQMREELKQAYTKDFAGEFAKRNPQPATGLDAMVEALPVFGRKIRGYDMADAMLTVKDEDGKQVFPTGGTRVLAYPRAALRRGRRGHAGLAARGL